MANKILISLQSLIFCFFELPVNRWASVGSVEELWQGLLSSVSWRLHYLLWLNSCCPSEWGFFCPQLSLCQGSGQWKLWAQVRHLAVFLARYWKGILGTFFPMLFPPVLQLLSPSMPQFTKYWADCHLSIYESCVWNYVPKIGTQTHMAGTLLYLITQSYTTRTWAWPKPTVPGFRT